LSDQYDIMNSGGYGVAAAMNVSQSGVIAAFGEFFSKSTLMTGGVGYGKYVLQMLNALNVKRVAIVVGFDALSRGLVKDLEETLLRAKITILTKLAITLDSYVQSNYHLMYSSLKAVDARYILVVNANPDVTADFYYKAGYGSTPPMPTDNNFTRPEFVEQSQKYFSGFLNAVGQTPELDAPTILKFNSTWRSLNAVDPDKYPILQNSGLFLAGGGYDCLNTILRGFDQ
ncbi:hypothetical protein HDU76_011197, partial [Blyttiomyces sp. JEL0837]